jgi:hypothetical protein
MMGLIIRLWSAARAFIDFMISLAVGAQVILGDARLEAIREWLWGTPQEQQQVMQNPSHLTAEEEALFAEFQRHMDTRYQVDMLARYVMTLPALPEEGY